MGRHSICGRISAGFLAAPSLRQIPCAKGEGRMAAGLRVFVSPKEWAESTCAPAKSDYVPPLATVEIPCVASGCVVAIVA